MNVGKLNVLTVYVIEPLGWMLVHSLWQLACCAALIAVSIRVLKRHSPQLRYTVCGLALIAMVTMPVGTLWLALPVVDSGSIKVTEPTALTQRPRWFASPATELAP